MGRRCDEDRRVPITKRRGGSPGFWAFDSIAGHRQFMPAVRTIWSGPLSGKPTRRDCVTAKPSSAQLLRSVGGRRVIAWRRNLSGWRLCRGWRRRGHLVRRRRLIGRRLSGCRWHWLHVGVRRRPAPAELGRVGESRRHRCRPDRWRRLDAHLPHPRPLRRRLGVGPREVGARWEVLYVVVHVPARGQGHAGVFDLAAGRSQDPTRRQR
jgi:hypothetical protein